MRTTVLFDTNAYRKLTEGKSHEEITALIQEIKQKEASMNITPSAVRIVAMEMVNLLNEGEGGPNFDNCKAGLSALALHCYEKEFDRFHLNPAPYANFALMAFGIKDENHAPQLNSIAAMVSLFRTHPTEAYQILKQNDTLKNYESHFSATEMGFAHDLLNLLENCKKVVKDDNPGPLTIQQYNKKLLKYLETNVEYTMLYAILYLIAARLDLHIDTELMQQKIQKIKNTYPAASGFYSYILSKIVVGNIDILSKKSRQQRWNWAWDYEVCCFISEKAVQTGQMLLVSADKDITKVLKKYNLGHFVMTLPEYLKHIGME
jgi:hypothetical protein